MKRKLTEATIKSLNPLDKRKIYPADYPGLELWINPGGGRTWYFQYRVKGKKVSIKKLIFSLKLIICV